MWLRKSETGRNIWNLGQALLLALAIIINIGSAQSPKPVLGGVVKVYSQYGRLYGSLMSVIHRIDSDNLTDSTSISYIFTEESTLPKHMHTDQQLMVANGDIKLKLCRKVDGLLGNYFENFEFAGIKKPWQTFMVDWSTAAIAGRFGINSSYVNGNYSYALLKVEWVHDYKEIAGPPVLAEVHAKRINKFSCSTFDFVKFLLQVGSHYISSFVTGDSLYQVFVFNSSSYHSLKSKLMERNLSELSTVELSDLFSPEHAVHVGRILSASGNPSVESWAAEHLRGPKRQFPYASLTHLHKNASLRDEVGRKMKNEALLGLDLKLLTPFFKSNETQECVQELLDSAFEDFDSGEQKVRLTPVSFQ